MFSEARQSTLEKVQENSQSLASDLLLSVSATQQTLPSLTSKAKAAFQDLVSSMNTSINNKSLFAGTATDRPALAPADDILTHLQAEVAGAATAQQARDAIEMWFGGAGFESDGYLGNNASIDSQVSEGVLVSSDLNAGSSAIVDLLAETAIAAMATEIPGLNETQSRELLNSAGEGLMAAQDAVTGLRADLGVVQERIEAAEAKNLAQKSALEIAHSEIISSDPFETATALESTRLQLEALYTVTARLSGLSLTSFLR
ncbi:flagellin [Shimia sediminis]|uniref:flagellin n=1 Tax=Shimia sediminis TaxID=2497945 RepID=UPI0034D195F5